MLFSCNRAAQPNSIEPAHNSGYRDGAGTKACGGTAKPSEACVPACIDQRNSLPYTYSMASTIERTETFISRAQCLAAGGQIDAALDLTYDSIDQMMHQDHLNQLDGILAALAAGDLATDLLLGILTATLPAKNRLPARGRLFKEAERVMRQRGDYEDGLLAGLEP
jgi:hypothetical protein